MISLDTLRADHLGCYGYHRDTSPFIDAFAKEAILFEQAVVQSPWTLPSHMSIMTSLYPPFHGVRAYDNYLGDEHVTLAEILKDNGYQTAAFTDGVFLSRQFGFQQGFDTYEDKRVVSRIFSPKSESGWRQTSRSPSFFLFTATIFMIPITPHPLTTLFFMILPIQVGLFQAIKLSQQLPQRN